MGPPGHMTAASNPRTRTRAPTAFPSCCYLMSAIGPAPGYRQRAEEHCTDFRAVTETWHTGPLGSNYRGTAVRRTT